MENKTVVFTGATGFIGKRLLEKVVLQNPKFHVVSLVQEKFVPIVKDHVKFLEQKIPGLKYTYKVCDITQPMLGMTEKDYQWFLQNMDQCYHLAAIYDLSISKKLARAVNVAGTKHVLSFCEQAHKNPLLVYFSTCYVSGWRKGNILESELKHSAGFKNFYEQTKYEAEIPIQEAIQKGKPIIVIRPGIVVGDSKTGETDKFDGIYAAMNMVSKLKFLPLRMPKPGKAEAKINMVPVDYLVDATVHIVQMAEETTGGTFHIADPNPIQGKELYDLCCNTITGRPSGFTLSPKLLEVFLSIKPIRQWLRAPRESVTYFNHHSHYDCRETLRALQDSGIQCPDSHSYFPILYEFWKKHANKPGYLAKF